MYMYQIDSRQVWVRTLTVPNGHLDYPNKLSNLTEWGGVLARKRSLFICFGWHFETINFRWASFGSEYSGVLVTAARNEGGQRGER